jgi:hypothetical protein
MMHQKLRIGLLLDSFDIPTWEYVMLEKIIKSDFSTIELIVLNENKKEKVALLTKIVNNNLKTLFYIAYCQFENKLCKCSPNAFEKIESKGLLADIPTLEVSPRQTALFDLIEHEDIVKIKSFNIDVFIRLGFRILRGEILHASRFGIWSYHHGDNQVIRGGPSGFWEVFEKHLVTGTTLQILTEDLDNGTVIYRSYSSTDPHYVNRNRNNYYWKSLSFLPRKLDELYRFEEKQFFDKIAKYNGTQLTSLGRIYMTPTNVEMIRLLSEHSLKMFKDFLFSKFYFKQWFLLFNLKDDSGDKFSLFNKIIPPKDRFWADPFIIFKNNLYYIFIEEYIYKNNKAHISLLIMDEKGNYKTPIKIIDRPYHLSYPFIFEWKDEYYMIPESMGNKSIEVYKCKEFPYKWEFFIKLMENVSAVDATLFYYQEKWWLFTNIGENNGASMSDELFLFSSDNPLSVSWKSHPQNPIVSDVRSARPAGKLFLQNGYIYRPSQDCSKTYGYAVKINRVNKLNDLEYEEMEVDSIYPNWDKNITAIHTFNKENKLTIIDGKIKRSKYF